MIDLRYSNALEVCIQPHLTISHAELCKQHEGKPEPSGLPDPFRTHSLTGLGQKYPLFGWQALILKSGEAKVVARTDM